jgi:hypothetical protein
VGRRSPLLVGIALAFILLAGVSTMNPAEAWAASGPLGHTNYRSVPAGVDSYGYWAEQVKAPDRVNYVDDPAGQRGIVQRIQVDPGDNNLFGSGTGERAEVTSRNDLGGFVDGQTIVMSWGVMIDSSFASPPGGWNSFVQIHVGGPQGQSPMSLTLGGDQADLNLWLFGGADPSGPEGQVGDNIPLGSLSKNQWHDFIMELRFGCDGTGYARLWLDGQVVADAQDRKIGYCGDPGMYWKQGFYRSAYDKPTQLWFSDTFRWASVPDAFAYYRSRV